MSTVYKVYDGQKSRGTFQSLKDALSFIGSSDLKLITVDYYQNGSTENGEPVVKPAHY